MIEQIRRCDVCKDLANIIAFAEGDANIKINTLDGRGDYVWCIGGGDHIDLCQKHKDEAFKLLTKLLGPPGVDK